MADASPPGVECERCGARVAVWLPSGLKVYGRVRRIEIAPGLQLHRTAGQLRVSAADHLAEIVLLCQRCGRPMHVTGPACAERTAGV